MIKGNKFRTDLFDVDDSDVIERFEELTGLERKNVFRIALRKSATILVNETTAAFKAKHGYKPRIIEKKNKKGEIKRRRVKLAKIVIGKDKKSCKVHILDDYKVKWFEMGTKERRTKGHRNVGYYSISAEGNRRYALRTGKPGYRGRIKAEHFFVDAQNRCERRVFDEMDKRVSEGVVKVWEKRK